MKVPFAAAGLYFLGVLSMFGTCINPDTTIMAAAVLVFFSLGILAGMTAGVFLGRAFYLRLRAKPRGFFPFILLAALNVLVFVSLGKPSPTEGVGLGGILLSAMCLVGAPMLLAATAYLLGLFFLPGRLPVPGARRAILIPLLYGSLAVGILAGVDSRLWQQGTVPLIPQRKLLPPAHPATLDELFRASAEWFPPEIKVDESDPKWVKFEAPAREEVEIVPGGEVFEATGPVVTVGDREVKVVGYAIYPPRYQELEGVPGGQGETRIVERETGPTTFWSPDGTPIDRLPLDDRSRLESDFLYWNTSGYECMFCISVPEGWGVSSMHRPTLGRFSWEESGLASGPDNGILWTQHWLLPVPSPMELRLHLYAGEKPIYTMPAREGGMLTLARNRVALVKMLPWSHLDVRPRDRESFEIRSVPKRGSGAGEVTTAVFYCVEPRSLRVEAVLDSGETMESERVFHLWGWVGLRFPVGMDRIREFRILEEPELFEVVFHLPKTRGLPPGNDGVRNRLDIQYPLLRLEAPREDGIYALPRDMVLNQYIRTSLGGWFSPDSPRSGVVFRPPRATSPFIDHRDVTMRDILDCYYPDRWWVSFETVYTTRDRFGPIVWKVKEALRELREE